MEVYMRKVMTLPEISDNIKQLELYHHSQEQNQLVYYKGLIKRGICFIVTKRNGEYIFNPSRFIGYVNNSIEAHESNSTRYGGETNRAISRILKKEPTANNHLEEEYQRFCAKLGIEAGSTGQFGCQRKYWTV
jgi:hypothetical protein